MDAGLPRRALTERPFELAIAALAKLAIGAAVLASGFRAVSDDDYARVVIAERFARAPALDPSGTSWLPFPFWVNGAAMALLGRDLVVARAVALILGAASIALVVVAARWLGASRAGALAAGLFAASFRWSALLGAATVPELPTAALALLGVASIAKDAPASRRVLGALALFAACLSRYEAWPLALAFAAFATFDAFQGAPASRRAALASALLALLGPALWVVWNRVAHGDFWHFFARVAAYRRALGEAADESLAARLFGYPKALVAEAPEVVALAVVVVGFAVRARASLARYVRPALVAVALVAALSLARVKDGAPTHHPERALLVVLLLLCVLAGDALTRARSRLALAAAPALALSAFVAWRALAPPPSFVARGDEEAIGRAARGAPRVLVEVVDYGHLAIVAAFGRPEDAALDRSIDPRDAPEPDAFLDERLLRERSARAAAPFWIARTGPTADALAQAITSRGAWTLYRAP